MLIMNKNTQYLNGSLPEFKVPGGINYFNINGEFKSVYITKVIYNNPATIVFWSDGTKTIAKCHEDDKYNCEQGLNVCILKKIFKSTYRDILNTWLPMYKTTNINIIELKDVRRFLKNKT